MDKYLDLRNRFITHGLSLLHPITIERGVNAILYDVEGKSYIDFTSGIGVTSLGHANQELIEVALEQLKKFWHICIMIANYVPYVELAKKLVEVSPGKFEKQVLFMNSGSEATENTVKIARQVTGRPYIVSFENSFHGRGSMFALALTGKYKPYKVNLEPFSPCIEFVPYPYCYRCIFGDEYPDCGLTCLDYIKRYFIHFRVPFERIAAFIIEVVQGEGGFVVAPTDYLRELKALLEGYGILLIDDEVQAGFGRTGRMWAIEHSNIEPDIMYTAKAIANGLPLSAIIGRREVMEKVNAGTYGGTYGGNPVACIVSLKVLEIFERDKLVERAAKLGEIVRKRFEEFRGRFKIIGDVRGLGLMQAIEFVRDERSKEPATSEVLKILEIARKKGLLLLRAGLFLNVIRVHPPLTIEEENLIKGLDILEEAIREVEVCGG